MLLAALLPILLLLPRPRPSQSCSLYSSRLVSIAVVYTAVYWESVGLRLCAAVFCKASNELLVSQFAA